nr:hypothetical protein [Tanacetum cinerariifolium]
STILLARLERLKEKHALELDTILSSLSASKVEVKDLTVEVVYLRRTLTDTSEEKQYLERQVTILEARIAELSRTSVLDRGESSFSVEITSS